jgi:hypothetical protein
VRGYSVSLRANSKIRGRNSRIYVLVYGGSLINDHKNQNMGRMGYRVFIYLTGYLLDLLMLAQSKLSTITLGSVQNGEHVLVFQ